MLITTKFIPHTNTKPDRIKATCGAEEIVLDWSNPKLNQWTSEFHGELTCKHVSAAMELAHMLELPPMQWHIHGADRGFLLVGAEGGSRNVIPF